MTRIALNGLGRIGKLVLRDLIDTGAGGDIVLLNDPVGDAEQHALLMEFDSVHDADNFSHAALTFWRYAPVYFCWGAVTPYRCAAPL